MAVEKNNHIDRILFNMKYKLNETPNYRPLVSSSDEFDKIPNEVFEADETPTPESGSTTNTPPSPENTGEIPGDEIPIPPDMSAGGMNMNPIENQGPNVDEIQNDIIKHNISAMQKIQSQLENLNNIVGQLDNKFTVLNAQVEEVKEPTNGEKLMSKKNVSYPYYFNLNDFWTESTFNITNKDENNGIKRLPDGTYIANFDDLPTQTTSYDNSFNNIV